MIQVSRRALLGGAVAATVLPAFAQRAGATDYARMKLPPPISGAERVQRIAKAQALMQRNGIGSLLIDPGQASIISPASNGGAASG